MFMIFSITSVLSLKMFAGILLLFSAFSLYTTVVQAKDSQATFVSHILQLRGNAYGISPCKIMCLASVFRHTRWRVPYKTSCKLSLTYLSLLLVTLSSEIELNPGPSFPCGSCGIEVLDDDAAVSCNNCDYWYHIQCQNISTGTYATLQAGDVSFTWMCMRCEAQNYSNHSNQSLTSFVSNNSFDALQTDSFASSCDVLQSDSTASSMSSSLSSPSPNTQTNTTNRKFPKLKVLNINFQSVRNKKPELHTLLDTERPDVVCGTESWLTPDISNSEILPPDLGYTMFRQDRKGNIGGGVVILVKDDIIASEQKQFQTDCEILWIKIELVGTRHLHIAAYYRPKENDAYSADEFRRSLEMVSKEKGDIWVLGDLNYPKLDWDKDDVPYIKAGCAHTKLYDSFIETMSDFNFSQMVREPTRQGNILDLFLTTNHTLVNSVKIIPGLSDHDIVEGVVDTKPASTNKAPRKVHLYRKADWDSLKSYMKDFCNSFVLSYEGKSVETLWLEFKEALNAGIGKFIPTKFVGQKKAFALDNTAYQEGNQKERQVI